MALEKETCSLYEFVSSGFMWKVVFVGCWLLCVNLGYAFVDNHKQLQNTFETPISAKFSRAVLPAQSNKS